MFFKLTHTHTTYGHIQSGLYSEAQQNASLENLESLLLSQTPEPTPELQNVTILEGANVILGGVFGDINELVDPISLDTVLDYVENDLEVFRYMYIHIPLLYIQ